MAALRKTQIGATVELDIMALADSSLTGAQKFEKVVASTLPLLATMVAGTSTDQSKADVADIACALVQTTYNDIMSTKAGSIASVILRLLGSAK